MYVYFTLFAARESLGPSAEEMTGARNFPPNRRARVRICKSFKEPRNRFPAWRAGTKPYLSYRPAIGYTYLAGGIESSELIPGHLDVYKYRL
jgi:hypothetical protein